MRYFSLSLQNLSRQNLTQKKKHAAEKTRKMCNANFMFVRIPSDKQNVRKINHIMKMGINSIIPTNNTTKKTGLFSLNQFFIFLIIVMSQTSIKQYMLTKNIAKIFPCNIRAWIYLYIFVTRVIIDVHYRSKSLQTSYAISNHICRIL